MSEARDSKKTASSPLPLAADSRDALRGQLARRYAFGTSFLAAVLGYAAYQLTPGQALGVPPEVRGPAATAFGTLVVAATALLGLLSFRRRFAELERIRSLQAQLTIYRVGETLDRLDREEELVRCALGVIAEGTGLPFWAIYRRDDRSGALRLTAVRGLPDAARPELEPDPIGPEARTPASRAAWLLETIVAREPGSAAVYAFAEATEGLGADPIVISVPLTDRGTAVGVLQCFVPRRRGFDADQLALLRWTASQLAVGLKRLRMERRDRMLASYLQNSAEIVLVLDADGRVADLNDAAERALGIAADSLRGRPVAEIAVEESTGRPFAGHDAPRNGATEPVMLRVRAGDGRTFACEAAVVSIAHPETGGAARLLVGHDVTERRDRERALRNYAEELRSLNGQLQQMNARLEAAQQAQQLFLASTSHELRTPLNGVIGFATLLEQGGAESEEEARSFAHSIRESAEHLHAVLNDILDLAKMESGQIDLHLEEGDACLSVRAAADAVRMAAEKKGLALRVELPESQLRVVHDPARLRQVMINVVDNAVKFTDQGEVLVRAWREDEHGEVRLEVSDTGVGIVRDQQPRLFTKFARVSTSYAGRRPGTGLGLAITKGLLERMGGSITIESEGPNRGTQVRITFPAPAPTAAAPAAPVTAGRTA